jgi:ABC-type nitrate/sulfonate/bicarbonate transport system permease component
VINYFRCSYIGKDRQCLLNSFVISSICLICILLVIPSLFSLNGLASSNSKNNNYIAIDKPTTIIDNATNKDSNQIWIISFVDLVIDSISSVYRMFSALGLSFLAAILIGITAARKPLASKLMIPIVDVLQSVPILGFFPPAIAFFIALFNGSSTGIELAAIFLIFTSMVWNMIFSVYESVLSIPSELIETSRAHRANPFLQLRRLYLPASIPKLIYNSILSWAGGIFSQRQRSYPWVRKHIHYTG